MTTQVMAPAWTPMAAEERARFDRVRCTNSPPSRRARSWPFCWTIRRPSGTSGRCSAATFTSTTRTSTCIRDVGEAGVLAIRRQRDRPRQLHRAARQPPDQLGARLASPGTCRGPSRRARCRSPRTPASWWSSTAGCGTGGPTTTRRSPGSAGFRLHVPMGGRPGRRRRPAGPAGVGGLQRSAAPAARRRRRRQRRPRVGHEPQTTPLYGELKRHGCLDSGIPALIR
jgi:hypothetical protein